MKISLLIFSILYCTSLFSQVIVQNFLDDALFSESPQTTVRSSGIGNYGFDSKEGFFNPHQSNVESEFSVGFVSLLNLNSGRYWINNISKKPRRDTDNFFDSTFDIHFKYKHNDYIFHLNYFTNLFFHQTLQDGVGIQLAFQTYDGPHTLISVNPTYSIINKSLQIAVTRKINSFTFALGFLTNRYKYKINLDDPYTIELNSSFFENFQLLLSLNYEYEDYLFFYILGRSQQSEIELIPRVKNLGTQIINKNKLLLSFPGLVAYGVQYKLLDELKISIEICHDFLTTNNDPVLYKKNGQELFTTEMVLGMTLNLFQNIKTGILYSRFLDYKSGIRTEWHIPYRGAEFFPLESLQMFKASTSYRYINWTFQINYQYGISTYDIADLGLLEENSHLVRFGICTDF
jgi:hypothetical protein